MKHNSCQQIVSKVTDPYLERHLAFYGIIMASMARTESPAHDKEVQELNMALKLSRPALRDSYDFSGHVGLANLGSTCYANGLLQLLARLPEVDFWL